MNKKRFFGIVLIILSFLFYIPRFTGAVIGISSGFLDFLGLILFIAGIVLLFVSLEEKVKIRNLIYESHALEMMRERRLLPVVVEDAIDSGEHYELDHVTNDEATRGATDVYIRKHSADVMPRGKGRSSRIIEVNPEKKREYKHVLVLTDKHNTIKTAYTASERDLRLFLKNYVEKKEAA